MTDVSGFTTLVIPDPDQESRSDRIRLAIGV